MTKRIYLLTLLVPFCLNQTSIAGPKEDLGERLFNEKNLSLGRDASCSTCHDPNSGFADPRGQAVSQGTVVSGDPGPRLGRRNAPTVTYAFFNGPFANFGGLISGGQFWDGRANDLVEQAKQPFFNQKELALSGPMELAERLEAVSVLAEDFKAFYGMQSLTEDPNLTLDNIADAIAAFERSPSINRFDSKFDRVLLGQDFLTEQEQQGLTLFEGKGKCNNCHTSGVFLGALPDFSDFQYRNLGLPKNNDIGYGDNPDEGLSENTGNSRHDGRFKTPHLRNVAITAPYMHNGIFNTLKEVVHFYNARDVAGEFESPEFSRRVNKQIGKLGLTDAEEDAIVAFLKTLTDADKVPAP